MKREAARLFPGWTREDFMGGPITQPTEKERLLQHAARLRDLAKAGMCAKKYTKEANRLEALAKEGL